MHCLESIIMTVVQMAFSAAISIVCADPACFTDELKALLFPGMFPKI